MKTIKQLILALIPALFIFTANASAQDKSAKKVDEVTFSVELDCPNCVKKLEAKLPYENGVKDLKVDLKTQTIWFLYKTDKTDKEKLAKALLDLGYPSKEVKKGEPAKKEK